MEQHNNCRAVPGAGSETTYSAAHDVRCAENDRRKGRPSQSGPIDAVLSLFAGRLRPPVRRAVGARRQRHPRWLGRRLSPPDEFWLSRTFRGVSHFQVAFSTRARSSSKPARPYIVRFSILRRLIWPSAGLVVHGSASAALIASKSRRRLVA